MGASGDRRSRKEDRRLGVEENGEDEEEEEEEEDELSEALQHLVQLGTAYVVQLLKAVPQAALDDRGGHNASLILPSQDPLSTPQFGGSERELSEIHSYRRAVRELKGKNGAGEWQGHDEEAGGNDGEKGAGKSKKEGE